MPPLRALSLGVAVAASQNQEAIKVAPEALTLARTPQERRSLEALIEAAQR